MDKPDLSTLTRRASEAKSDRHSARYYVKTKHGWRCYTPPAGEQAPFVARVGGETCFVYRSQNDAEFFSAHHDAHQRLTVRESGRKFFTFEIVTRDGERAEGDSYDFLAKMARCSGTAFERLRDAVRLLLADENLCRRAVQ